MTQGFLMRRNRLSMRRSGLMRMRIFMSFSWMTKISISLNMIGVTLLADGAIAGKITIIGLEFDMTKGKILIGMMDKYDNDLMSALGAKQREVSLATTVEQVRAIDAQSGYPDKVNITMTYVRQQAKEKDVSDPQKVAVRFSRMVVNNKTISLSPNEKLDVRVLFPIWGQEGAEFGLSVDAGFCLRVVKDDTDILYEVIQQHTLSKEWNLD